MRLRRPGVEDAEALTDLHLDVWEQAYGQLAPPHVLADRRASRSARVDRWREVLSHSAGATWLADDGDTKRLRAVRFYERHGFAFDGCTRAEPVGFERRMVRPARVE